MPARAGVISSVGGAAIVGVAARTHMSGAEGSHTILLLQPTSQATSRTYQDFETLELALSARLGAMRASRKLEASRTSAAIDSAVEERQVSSVAVGAAKEASPEPQPPQPPQPAQPQPQTHCAPVGVRSIRASAMGLGVPRARSRASGAWGAAGVPRGVSRSLSRLRARRT